MPPAVIHHQVAAVQAAPDDKWPTGTMPQPTEQHGQEQVDVAPGRPLSVAAECDIQVVAQKL